MSRYLKKNSLYHFKDTSEFFRLRSLKKKMENKLKQRSLNQIIQELEFCAPYCPHASFLESDEMCRYSGMLKCNKYDALVGKYSPCLGKRKK